MREDKAQSVQLFVMITYTNFVCSSRSADAGVTQDLPDTTPIQPLPQDQLQQLDLQTFRCVRRGKFNLYSQ